MFPGGCRRTSSCGHARAPGRWGARAWEIQKLSPGVANDARSRRSALMRPHASRWSSDGQRSCRPAARSIVMGHDDQRNSRGEKCRRHRTNHTDAWSGSPEHRQPLPVGSHREIRMNRRPPSQTQVRAVRTVMRLLAEDDLSRGVARHARRWCERCRTARPAAGFISYPGASLCNSCALAYELTRLRCTTLAPASLVMSLTVLRGRPSDRRFRSARLSHEQSAQSDQPDDGRTGCLRM